MNSMQQQGVILAMVLILLFAFSLLVISGAELSQLDWKMLGAWQRWQKQQLAFSEQMRDLEQALIRGENFTCQVPVGDSNRFFREDPLNQKPCRQGPWVFMIETWPINPCEILLVLGRDKHWQHHAVRRQRITLWINRNTTWQQVVLFSPLKEKAIPTCHAELKPVSLGRQTWRKRGGS